MQKEALNVELEQQVNQLLVSPSGTTPHVDLNPQENPLFSMQSGQTSMPNIGSFLKVKSGNVIVIALGVIFSSTVGGFITRFIPSYSQYAVIIAGVLLMYFAKSNGMLHDFGVGVLIAGLASTFSNLGGMLSGATQTSMNDVMSEDRVTYGGSDGVYPTQPERRTVR